jgi:hypothetical protein
MEDEIPFPEWMVAGALRHFVSAGPNVNEHIDWFLDSFVKIPASDREILKDLCGFDRNTGGFATACETGLKLEDRGQIEEDTFKKVYWGIRPDIRFWANEGQQQLLIELKGRGPNDNLDLGQARRYFSYLRDRGVEGAVVYVVPCQVDPWLDLVQPAASGTSIRFGVIQCDYSFRELSAKLRKW